ncbi:MAG TPA: ABC transporter permease [Candidatus Bathyarchaeia archaeon]|nr:ABC transporter permease [Candidatus Bathyarchaeia archaeon]
MKLSDLFSESLGSLMSNKARSGLTLLGIVIGIASVIVMVGVGQGATAAITNSISALGSNLIVVTPASSTTAGPVNGGSGSAVTLTLSDATALKKSVQDAKAISADIAKRYQVVAGAMNTNTTVTGTQPTYFDIRNVTIADGATFTDQDITAGSAVAVLGPTTRDNLFGSDAPAVGKMIRINSVQFKVIGVATAKGSSGVGNPDDGIYIPLTAAQRYLAGPQASLTSISIEANSADVMNAAQNEVTQEMLQLHNLTDISSADFQVVNQAQISASLSTTTQTLTLLLGSIAGISLLVGGIGIMNMMLTTVTERTREIGLRKSVGAKQSSIRAQFLSEAVILTAFGGVVGIICGLGIAWIATSTGAMSADVTWWSVVLAFGVSTVIGVVFGYYPAGRASRLKPIEALKYE